MPAQAKIKKRKKKPMPNKGLESLASGGFTEEGMSQADYLKIGNRRAGVADPRFHRYRGDKKKDPLNLVGKAISKDQASRDTAKERRKKGLGKYPGRYFVKLKKGETG
tara:strand:- start:181 stop:504 length:324 start_codon:yes stop_codon:yes gene_type:complete